MADFLFKITADGDCSHEIRNQKMIASWQESNDKPRQCVEKQRYYSADKGPYSQGYGLTSGHVLLWELDHKEGRMPKNWCFLTVVLDNTPESPLDSKKFKTVNLPEYSLEGLMLKLKLQYFSHLMWMEYSLEKSLMLRKTWGQKEKRASEDDMTGWHHRCNEHELGQTPGGGEG